MHQKCNENGLPDILSECVVTTIFCMCVNSVSIAKMYVLLHIYYK